MSDCYDLQDGKDIYISEKQTPEEVKSLIDNLRNVFDIVKLIDVKTLTEVEISNEGAFKETEKHCYEFFKKEKNCENCIGIKSCECLSKQEKYEFIDEDVYHIISKCIIVNENSYALELISLITDNIFLDFYGKNRFSSALKNANHKFYIDSLTNCYNRRYFVEHLSYFKTSMGIAVFDINDFSLINSSYGFSIGDVCLVKIADIIKKRIRKSDNLVRYSGDDFLLAIKEISKKDFLCKLSLIQKDIENLCFDEIPNLRLGMNIACLYQDYEKNSMIPFSKQFFVSENSPEKKSVKKLLSGIVNYKDKKIPPAVINDVSKNVVTNEVSVMKNFASDYNNILFVDLDTGLMTVYQTVGMNIKWINDAAKLGFENFKKQFAENFLCPEDINWFLESTTRDSIKKHLQYDNVYFLNHRILRNGVSVYYQTKIVKDSSNPDRNTVLIGGHDVDKHSRKDIKMLEEISLAHHNSVIASLSMDFDYVGYVNPSAREVFCFKESDEFKKLFDVTGSKNFSCITLDRFFKTIVYEKDFDLFLEMASFERIFKAFEKEETYEVFFRVNLGEKKPYYMLKFVKDKSKPSCYIIGLMSFDEEVRKEIEIREHEETQKIMEEKFEKIISERTEELQKKNFMLNRMNEDIIELLGEITEARDIESGEHIKRVKNFTRILALQVMNDYPELELTEEKIEIISSASALHDIGKITIPDAILLKPAKLTPEEFEIMKSHCVNGCEILKKAPQDWSSEYLSASMEICRWHHEKWDGKGYPDGLKEDEIPLSAQIVAVADCFDALTSKRCYKDAIGVQKAFDMIQNGECGIFASYLMKSFVNCKDECFKLVLKN